MLKNLSTLERQFLKIRDAVAKIGELCKISELSNDFDPRSLRFDFPDGHYVQVVIQDVNEQEFDRVIERVKQLRAEHLKKY